MDNPDLFRAFINAILRLTFYNEKSVTGEFLKENLFKESPITADGMSLPSILLTPYVNLHPLEIQQNIVKFQAIFRNAARDDIELDELENRMASVRFVVPHFPYYLLIHYFRRTLMRFNSRCY